jgi:hypothetical protein
MQPIRQQKIIDKNGIKFIKLSENKFNLTFDMNNNNIILPSIINFDLIQLIYKLNPNIFENVSVDNNSETNVTINILLKDVFSDLGLPHYFLALNVTKVVIDANKILFNCSSFDNKLDIYDPDVELIPIQKFDIYFNIIQNHNINVSCNIDLIDNHNIPAFAEKMIGNIIYNIFNRLKQFIDNVSV